MTALSLSPLRPRPVLAMLGAAAAVAATPILTPVPATAGASLGTSRPSAVIGVRVFGHSVQGRGMKAYHAGDPKASVTVVSISAMHGNEQAAQITLRRLRDWRPIHGVNLWVIPSANPDGAAHHDRHNAHAVDLNRNFPTRGKPLTGYYYSGPRPASEPETKALALSQHRGAKWPAEGSRRLTLIGRSKHAEMPTFRAEHGDGGRDSWRLGMKSRTFRDA